MAYIKKLQIYGFKSFGFKNTVINFEKGLVAVTGPNGSGKSNVLDAIMFAIGENSPKALRVDKFQSLFHDSQHSSHKLIRVSLTFDNVNRGIPVNFDSVTLTREMEGQTGESQYYLNDKKVSKSTITELLEVVMPGPSKLNVVQQGMITRISELNSDERRKIIEDIIGLSYFDDKKTEALKQLEESDRRLEVALAKMGEIRKRIDELEAERNDQLRYEHLESELKRFKAIWISNKISIIVKDLESQNRILDSNVLASSKLSKQLEEIRAQIENLESEKSAFIKKVDAENKAKAQVGSRIATIVYEAERTKAMLKQSQNRVLEIQQRVPTLDEERKNIVQRLDEFYPQVQQKKVIIADRSNKILALKFDLSHINSEIEALASKNTKYSQPKAILDRRYKRLSWVKNNISISLARLEEKIKVNNDKLMLNESLVSSKKAEIEEISTALSELSKNLEQHMTLLNSKTRLIEKFKHSKIKLDEELSSSCSLLNKADNLAKTYEIKQDIIRNLNNEDVTIAELIKHTATHGIKELVHTAIKYDRKYERAIFAAASEWLKALIVNDTKSMISIARYIKLRKLPRLKMIPLDILGHIKAPKSLDDVTVIGNLADFVYSDYKNLSGFLFGNTLLVKSSTAAYILAQEGYRTVSIDGVLFEASGRGLVLDFGSQMSDLTKAILLADSVRGLRIVLSNLKMLTEKKSSELAENIAKISDSETEKIKAEAKIAGIRLQFLTLEASKSQTEKILDKLVLDSTAIQSEKDSWVYELKRYQKQMLLLTNIIDSIYRSIRDLDQAMSASEAIHVNMLRKNDVLRSIEELDIEIREMTTSSLSLNNQIDMGLQNLKGVDEQKQLLKSELQEMSKQVTSFSTKLESLESELQILRDKEQQVIGSSGSSYSLLQEYEQEIKDLRDTEKKISKEYNTIEKEIAMLRRDILDNSSEQSRLHNDLNSLGYKEKGQLEAFDVDLTVKELTAELEATKTRINLRAHESYVQVIDGYRGISTRQNQLESERNSIVLFIEGVIKEKNSVFMEAFRKVDEDIRKSFSEVAGGQAWLEIENVEDIFASGIMLIVQFPGKPGRESTALSGGEKTIAAAIFLLALQSLKPSPFYLMDEIDAHLDADNNDRLSRVLLSRSKDNQIFVVTLKDTTVAKADMIYGVYPKEGMSQIVKYKHSSNQAIAEVTSNNNI